MSKKKNPVITSLSLSLELQRCYKRLKDIYENGCSDPTWTDGVNIDLVRNHIIYGKSQCEKVLGDNFIAYPDEYFYPLPVELPDDFMAVDRKLACRGEYLTANKSMCYSEVVKFDWGEVLNEISS